MLGIALASGVVVVLGVSLAGADPSLKDQIDSAKSNAGQLSGRVTTQTARIVSLTQQAHQAGAQAMVVAAQVEETEAHSRELAAELRAAEARLVRLRAEYAAAVKQLEERLVAIYQSDTPDEVTVLLNSNGYDDLATRAAYLEALHNADRRIADRVASLRQQVADHVRQVTDLKQQADAEARQLSAARASLIASQETANQAAAAVSAARAQTEASLSDAKGQVEQLEEELVAQQAAQQQAASGAPAYLGGPFAIPTYIVMCESGGNYSALNASSGAGGAYQILPSTWRAYGGQGLPHQAPKEEQDRIAAQIWADSGPSAWACA
ncbi:MAG TPA: transglycosylase family protein [Solirubrobacterales bacterium]|nr:transglycosylase family protein [Solirubrobacterales bacterium]